MPARRPWYSILYVQVLIAIASMSDLTKVGRVGLKTLLYFEVVSTVALAIGLLVGEIVHPGAGFNIDPATLDAKAVSSYVSRAKEEGIIAHLMAIIPNSFFGALANGDLLQVLLVSILTGFAISRLGQLGKRIAGVIDTAAKVFFRIIGFIVRAAPLGAFGAMAFTIGAYGVGALWNLAALIFTFYATSALFVLIVLGTSSSETVLPHMIQKMERVGASRAVVGLVIPTGYSFNLDGTNIYMTLATLFLAQATNTPLTVGQELTILG